MKLRKRVKHAASIGIGERSDFTKLADQKNKPGPGHHNSHIFNSIAKNSVDKVNPKHSCTFQNGFEKYNMICYKGMEQAFYLTQSKGPGSYVGLKTHDESQFKSASQFSIPKQKRGLLERNKHRLELPGPTNYRSAQSFDRQVCKKEARATIGNETRDIPFSKYISNHKSLILKGLF